eukprot:COSAG01_NODE_3272_length_6321_cov_12.850530_6_plen_164_part_00
MAHYEKVPSARHWGSDGTLPPRPPLGARLGFGFRGGFLFLRRCESDLRACMLRRTEPGAVWVYVPPQICRQNRNIAAANPSRAGRRAGRRSNAPLSISRSQRFATEANTWRVERASSTGECAPVWIATCAGHHAPTATTHIVIMQESGTAVAVLGGSRGSPCT